jgi:RimJ/RimL family protein N-acetyltransferase
MTHVRLATKEDSLRIFNMRNEPSIYSKGFKGKPVTLDEHDAWFRKTIGKTPIFIISFRGKTIGCLRFDVKKPARQLETSIYLREAYCGEGHGPRALSNVCPLVQSVWREYTIIARFLPENYRSRAAFYKAGFVKSRGSSMRWVRQCA